MTPEEPGFLLERVPVHSIKEVLGILEVRAFAYAIWCYLKIVFVSVLGCERTVLVERGTPRLQLDNRRLAASS